MTSILFAALVFAVLALIARLAVVNDRLRYTQGERDAYEHSIESLGYDPAMLVNSLEGTPE